SGQELASSGTIAGNTPNLPAGVLKDTSSDKDKRFTWQPQNGVRLATVIVETPNRNYVLIARSMRGIEKREDHVLLISILGWLISLALLGAFWLGHWQSQ